MPILTVAAVAVGCLAAMLVRLIARRIAPHELTLPRSRAIIDAAVTSAAILVAANHAPSLAAAAGGIIAVTASQIASHVDVAFRVIPNRLTYRLPAILAAATLAGWLLDRDATQLLAAIITAVIAPLVLLSLSAVYARYTGMTGFGMGDIKLVGSLAYAMMLWGMSAFAVFAYTTFLAATLWSSLLILTGRAHRKSRVAFAPFFTVGVVLAVVVWPLFTR